MVYKLFVRVVETLSYDVVNAKQFNLKNLSPSPPPSLRRKIYKVQSLIHVQTKHHPLHSFFNTFLLKINEYENLIDYLMNRGSPVVGWNGSREEHLSHSFSFYDWENNSRCTLL